MATPMDLPTGMSEVRREVRTTVVHSDVPVQPQVPVVHNASTRTPQELLNRLLEFNRHVEHIARVEGILMHDMGLSKEDAGVFIRAGVEGVFGKIDEKAAYSGKAGDILADHVVGFWMNELR
jgi:hypothetical protein